jgi:hypothetical protein
MRCNPATYPITIEPPVTKPLPNSVMFYVYDLLE